MLPVQLLLLKQPQKKHPSLLLSRQPLRLLTMLKIKLLLLPRNRLVTLLILLPPRQQRQWVVKLPMPLRILLRLLHQIKLAVCVTRKQSVVSDISTKWWGILFLLSSDLYATLNWHNETIWPTHSFCKVSQIKIMNYIVFSFQAVYHFRIWVVYN